MTWLVQDLLKVFRLQKSIDGHFQQALAGYLGTPDEENKGNESALLVDVSVPEDDSNRLWFAEYDETNIEDIFLEAIDTVQADTGCSMKIDVENHGIIVKGAGSDVAMKKLSNIERNHVCFHSVLFNLDSSDLLLQYRKKIYRHIVNIEQTPGTLQIHLPRFIDLPYGMLLRTLTPPDQFVAPNTKSYLIDLLADSRTCRIFRTDVLQSLTTLINPPQKIDVPTEAELKVKNAFEKLAFTGFTNSKAILSPRLTPISENQQDITVRLTPISEKQQAITARLTPIPEKQQDITIPLHGPTTNNTPLLPEISAKPSNTHARRSRFTIPSPQDERTQSSEMSFHHGIPPPEPMKTPASDTATPIASRRSRFGPLPAPRAMHAVPAQADLDFAETYADNPVVKWVKEVPLFTEDGPVGQGSGAGPCNAPSPSLMYPPKVPPTVSDLAVGREQSRSASVYSPAIQEPRNLPDGRITMAEPRAVPIKYEDTLGPRHDWETKVVMPAVPEGILLETEDAAPIDGGINDFPPLGWKNPSVSRVRKPPIKTTTMSSPGPGGNTMSPRRSILPPLLTQNEDYKPSDVYPSAAQMIEKGSVSKGELLIDFDDADHYTPASEASKYPWHYQPDIAKELAAACTEHQHKLLLEPIAALPDQTDTDTDIINETVLQDPEAETRRFHNTMGQQKGKRGKRGATVSTAGLERPDPIPAPAPRPAPTLRPAPALRPAIQARQTARPPQSQPEMAAIMQMLEYGRSSRGPVDIEVQFGQSFIYNFSQSAAAFVKGQMTIEKYERKMPELLFEKEIKTYFSRRLTTSISEASRLVVPDIFGMEPYKVDAFYELIVQDRDNKEIRIKTFGDGDQLDCYEVTPPSEHIGEVYYDFPKRFLDARLAVVGYSKYEVPEAVEKLVKTIHTTTKPISQPGTSQEIEFKFRNESSALRVKAVLGKRQLHYRSTEYQDLSLQLTEVRDLTVQNKMRHDPAAYRVLGQDPTQLVKNHKLWFEASILVSRSPLVEQNNKLQLGDDASWEPQEILSEDLLHTIKTTTEVIMSRLDATSVSNHGLVGTEEDLAEIDRVLRANADKRARLNEPFW